MSKANEWKKRQNDDHGVTVTSNGQEFWNNRANLGEAAGTQDVVLKRLEIAELIKRVPFGSRVLDVGCGNGLTLKALAREKACTGRGIDLSKNMIAAANEGGPWPGLEFYVENVIRIVYGDVPFDVAISERCLINLVDSVEQHVAFCSIMEQIKVGGRYYMVENSYDGLAKLNALRTTVNLPAMKPPWHNLYFHEEDVLRWQCDKYSLEQVVSFTSTYYVLSRVINARLAADTKKEPEYESPINLMALKLPVFGDVGATRMWVWRRNK